MKLGIHSIFCAAIASMMLAAALHGLFLEGAAIRTLTAINFILSSSVVFLMAVPRRTGTQMWISFTSFLMLISVIVTVTAASLNTTTFLGDENVVIYFDIRGIPHASNTYFPSVGAAFGFILMSMSGLVYLFNTDRMYRRIKCLGIAVTLVGLMPFIHALTGIPYLDFGFPWWYAGNGMSLYTASLFFLYGLGLRSAIKSVYIHDYGDKPTPPK